jgi:hypothetical protein
MRIEGELGGIGRCLEELVRPPAEEGDEVLGEAVVDEDQVARAPREHLPAQPHVEPPRSAQGNENLPYVDHHVPRHGIRNEVALEQKVGTIAVVGKVETKACFREHEVVGHGWIVSDANAQRRLTESMDLDR